MKIESASIAMQSTRVAVEHMQVTQRIEHWGRARPATSPTTATSLASDANAESAHAKAIEQGIEAARDDPRYALLLKVIELVTGRPARILRLEDFRDPTPLYAAPTGPLPGTAQAQGAGMSMRIDVSRSEYEYVAFASQGVVRTADGREIRFEVGFEMERRWAEHLSIEMTAGTPRQLKDPLVLDFGGTGASLSDTRFAFDLDANGELDEVPLLAGGRGFLAFDRNGNGRIDDGSELFGALSGNGFAELAALDADGNGWIDEADPAFKHLRVWMPDENGEGKLKTLAEAGVGALSLSHLSTPFSIRNAANETLGLMRSSGIYLTEDGNAGTISQVDLAV
jgi:hypothetical protein